MRTIAIAILLVLTSLQVEAQWERKFKAGLNGGYEWNIFLNPAIVSGEEETLFRDELWVSAPYQGGFLSADFHKDLGKSRWKIGTYLSGANYNSRINANRHSFRLNLSYRTKYAARKYFEIAPTIYRVKRVGVNDQDAILSTPFSYLRLTLPVKFDFYLKNKVWLKTTTGYLYRSYDRTNDRQLAYHAGFIGASLSKKWSTRKSETKLTYTNRVEMRLYKNLEFFIDEPAEEGDPTESEEVEESSRIWTYVSNDLEYSIKPGNKRFKLNMGLYSTIRLDSEEENSYMELAPGINGEWKLKNWTLSTDLSYVYRNYSEREVGEEEIPLQYKYIRGSVKAEVPLRKNMDFYIRSNVVNRASSNDLLTRGFREYFNSRFEVGVVLRF